MAPPPPSGQQSQSQSNRSRKKAAAAAAAQAQDVRGAKAAQAMPPAFSDSFAMKCEAFKMYYAAVGKQEWWWVMDDVQVVIATQLQTQGYVVLDGFLLPEQVSALRREVQAAHAAGRLEHGGLVNAKVQGDEAKYADTKTRGDLIGWFDSNEADWPYGRQLEGYLVKLGTLISELGRPEANLVPELGRATSRSKAMVACYPGGGARYVRHVDNDGKHPFCRTRLLTALLYLNEDWQPGDGGELAVYSRDDRDQEREVVAPLANRLLLFWSDWRTPHEVRPAHKPRYAVTLWVLDNTCNGTLPGTPVEPATMTLSELAAATPSSQSALPSCKPEDVCRRADAPAAVTLQPAHTATNAAAHSQGRPEHEVSLELRYEWLWLGADGQEGPGGPWELRVEMLGEEAECPVLDLSEEQVRIADSSGRPLLCVPRPAPGPASAAGAPRWSRKRRQLSVRFDPTVEPGSAAAPVGAAGQSLAVQLRQRGWGFAEGFLAGPEADDLRAYVLALRAAGRLQVGRNGHEGPADSGATKNDEYTFLEDTGAPDAGPLRVLCRRANQVLAALMREGGVAELRGVKLTQGKPMLAVYPGNGARYGRHYDATVSGKGDNGRVLTLLVYLNPFWREQDGGSLRLFRSLSDEAGVADIAPLHGRVAAFLCREQWPHEVLPSWADRVAVTLWYYDGDRLAERCTGADISGFGFEGG